MLFKEQFFDESCFECLQISTLCPDDKKRKCYIEWADKKIVEYHNYESKIKKQLVVLNKTALREWDECPIN